MSNLKKEDRVYLQSIIDETTTVGITYIGKAEPGVAMSTDKWQIKVVDETGATIEIKYPNGKSNFEFIWDNRATYTYSIPA